MHHASTYFSWYQSFCIHCHLKLPTPQIGQPLRIEVLDARYEKSQFSPVHIIVFNGDDLVIGVFDLLFYEFLTHDCQFSMEVLEGANHDNVPSILSEGFAKILLSNNFASIYVDLHVVILM
jgi:condensin complex subunit 3